MVQFLVPCSGSWENTGKNLNNVKDILGGSTDLITNLGERWVTRRDSPFSSYTLIFTNSTFVTSAAPQLPELVEVV